MIKSSAKIGPNFCTLPPIGWNRGFHSRATNWRQSRYAILARPQRAERRAILRWNQRDSDSAHH